MCAPVQGVGPSSFCGLSLPGSPPSLPATIWRTSATTAGHEDGTGTGNNTPGHNSLALQYPDPPSLPSYAMAPRPGEEPQNRCRASGPSWQTIGSPRHCGPSNPPGDIPSILRLVILHHNTTHTHRRLQLQSGMYLANLVMLHPMIHSRPGSPLEQCCRGSQPQAPRPASQTNAPSNVP